MAKNLNPVFKFFEKNNIPLSQIIFKVSDEIIQKESEGKYFVNYSENIATVYMALGESEDDEGFTFAVLIV